MVIFGRCGAICCEYRCLLEEMWCGAPTNRTYESNKRIEQTRSKSVTSGKTHVEETTRTGTENSQQLDGQEWLDSSIRLIYSRTKGSKAQMPHKKKKKNGPRPVEMPSKIFCFYCE